MRNWIILLTFCIATSPSIGREVYKGTSEDGTVIYSDTYQPGTEKISIKGERSVSSESNDLTSSVGVSEDKASSDYRTFEIVQPANGETIRSDEDALTVVLNLAPGLAESHKIQVYLDGIKLDSDLTSTSFSLSALNRGTYTLQAKVIDLRGKVLISTQPVSFQLRKEATTNP